MSLWRLSARQRCHYSQSINSSYMQESWPTLKGHNFFTDVTHTSLSLNYKCETRGRSITYDYFSFMNDTLHVNNGKSIIYELRGSLVVSSSVSSISIFSPWRNCVSLPFTRVLNIMLKCGMLACSLLSLSIAKLVSISSGSWPNLLHSVRCPPKLLYCWTASSVVGICSEVSGRMRLLDLIRWFGTPLPVLGHYFLNYSSLLKWHCISTMCIPGIRCSFHDFTTSDVPALATCRVNHDTQYLWASASMSKSPLSSMATKHALMG